MRGKWVIGRKGKVNLLSGRLPVSWRPSAEGRACREMHGSRLPRPQSRQWTAWMSLWTLLDPTSDGVKAEKNKLKVHCCGVFGVRSWGTGWQKDFRVSQSAHGVWRGQNEYEHADCLKKSLTRQHKSILDHVSICGVVRWADLMLWLKDVFLLHFQVAKCPSSALT